jgi:hypothetical protein
MSDKDNYILIKFNCDYADEFDVYGFEISTRKKHNEYVDKLAGYPKMINAELYFGTNEVLEFDTVSDYMHCIDIKDITKEEYDSIERLFGRYFGIFPDLLEHLEDRDDEDDY